MDDRTAPFGRLLTAVISPFDAAGAVDYETFSRLVEYLGDNGTEGVVVCGTTGESPTLSPDEKVMLFRTAVDAVGSTMTVIAGTGTYNTAESVELTERAAAAGCDGVMAVTPYYSKPPQEGLYRHFTAIAEATDLPVLLYNVPGRTSRLIEVDTLVRLAAHPGIVAVKDAVDDIEFTRQSLARLPDDFAVYAGSDFMLKDIVLAGGVGVVSVASHLVGPQLARLLDASVAGDVPQAEKIHDALMPVFDALFAEPNPIPVKAAVNRWWAPVGDPRLPLIPAAESTLELVERGLEAAVAV
jgi:4-hydroxy-tetrahydrodipicolinate synthase